VGKKNKDCVYWVAVLFVGLALGVVGGLAIAGIAYPIYQSEKWAAWVQALGSIGAIVGAVWLFFAGLKQKERERRDEYATHILFLMETIELISKKVVETIEDEGAYLYYLRQAETEAFVDRIKEHQTQELAREVLGDTYKGVEGKLKDYCFQRGEMLRNALGVMKLIDWTRYPNSVIGPEIVALTNELYFFHSILTDDARCFKRKGEELKRKAGNVNLLIHDAIAKLNKHFGYVSQWPYGRELAWRAPRKRYTVRRKR